MVRSRFTVEKVNRTTAWIPSRLETQRYLTRGLAVWRKYPAKVHPLELKLPSPLAL